MFETVNAPAMNIFIKSEKAKSARPLASRKGGEHFSVTFQSLKHIHAELDHAMKCNCLFRCIFELWYIRYAPTQFPQLVHTLLAQSRGLSGP